MAKKKQQIPITPQMQAEFNRYSQILSDTPIAPIGASGFAPQQTKPIDLKSYGMTMDRINQAVGNTKNNEIPTLQQTPSIQSELSRMEKAKADTTTPRTEGEQKAIDTYYNGLKEAVNQQNKPVDYKSEIDRVTAMKNNTTAQRTQGENQAIDTYLASLIEAQKYVDSQNKVSQTVSQKKNVSQQNKTDKKAIEQIKAQQTKEMQATEQKDYSLLNESINAREQAMKQAYDKQQLKNSQMARENEIKDAIEREQIREEEFANENSVKGFKGTKLTSKTMNEIRNNDIVRDTEKGGEGSGAYIGQNNSSGRGKKVLTDKYAQELRNKESYTESDKEWIDKAYKELEDNGLYKGTSRTYLNPLGDLQEKIDDGTFSPEYVSNVIEAQGRTSLEGAALSGLANFGVQIARLPVLTGALLENNNADPNIRMLNKGVAGSKTTFDFTPGNEWTDTLQGLGQIQEETNKYHPVGSAIGNIAGSMTLYGAANGLTEGLAGALSPIKNIILGQGIDNVLDTVPELAMNMANGKYTKADGTTDIDSIALDWAISNGLNLLGNVGGELLANGFNKQAWKSDLADIANDNRGSFITKTQDINVQDAIKETEIPKIEAPIEQPKVNVATEIPRVDIPQNTSIAPRTVVDNTSVKTPITVPENVSNPIEETLAKEFPTYQTEDMRSRQNGLKVSNEVPQQPLTQYDMTQEKQAIREYVDNLNMSDEKRAIVSEQLDSLDKVLDDFNNAKTNDAVMKSMDNFEKIYSDINKELSADVTYTEFLDNGLSSERKTVRDALQGKRIVLPKEWQAEFPDSTLKEINQSIYMGPGSGRFVRNATNGASTIDASFSEIDNALGGKLTSYMVSNGLDPDVPQNQAKALVDYLSSFKGQSTNSVREVAYDGGLLDDTFQSMINRASERGIEIDENALRKRMRVSDFRTNNQGNLGLTDEELVNSYFSTDNKNFQFLKGDRNADTLKARENLTTDYEGTKQKLLSKPSWDAFTPQEVDEAFMAYQKELDLNREIGNGDYSSSAEMLYKLTQDAHDKGAGLQAYAKWKANTPVGVVLDTSSTARDFATSKFGQDYIDDIDKLVKDIKNVADSDLSFEEQAKEVERLMREMQSKGYKNGVNGFEQMQELLTTGSRIKSMVYEDLKQAGRVVTMEDFENMLKTSSYEQIATDLRQYGKVLTKDDYDTMLKSGKAIDTVTIKDLIYAANDIPNIDAKSQMDILNIAEEMYGKNLSATEKQKYINQINVILSKQKGWSKKDKAIELSHIMMLSGPKTHVKNFVANVGMLPQEALARKISAVGQNAYHLINPDYKPTQAFHVTKQSKQLASDFLDNIGGVETLLAGSTDKYSGTLARKLGANYMYTFNKEGKRNVIAKANDYLTNAIPSLKNVENTIGNKADNFFKKIGSEGAYSTLSGNVPVIENARQLVYESLGALEDNPFVKTNFEKRLASFIEAQNIKSITDIPKEAVDIAKAEALKATFKDDNAITGLFSSIKKFPIIGETELPYVKTPANLLARSIDYSPVGIARSLYGMVNKNSRFAQETVGEAIDELSKGLGGTATGLLGMYLYANDILSGAAPDDDDEKKFLQEEGWQEYSVSTKGIADFINNHLGTDIDLGDDYISYSWLQPSTTNMIASTMLYDELADGKDITDKSIEDIANRLKKLGGAYVDSLLEQSTLQDVGNLFDTSYGQGAGENLLDSIIQTPTRYFSGLVTTATQLSDDNKREYYSKNKPIETAINLAKSKIPGLSETLPSKYDAFGNEITRNKSEGSKWINTLINPANTTHPTDEPMYSEIDKVNEEAVLNAEDGVTPKQYIPNYPGRSLTLSDDSKYDLDNEEYSKITRKVGKYRKEIEEEFVNSDIYDKLSAEDKIEIYDKIDALANTKGALDVNSDVKVSEDNQKLIDIYDESGTEGFLDYLSYKNTLKNNGLKDSDTRQEIWNNYGEEGITKWLDYGIKDAYAQTAYVNAKKEIPSLSEGEFADTYRKMDSNNRGGISQDEVIAYLNANNIKSESEAQKIYNAYAKNPGKYIPVLENGTWKKKQK